MARKHKEVWGCKIPLKIKAFMWLVYQEKILTKSYISKWVPDIEKRCVLCGAEDETVTHLFIACPMVKQVWRWMSMAGGLGDSFTNLESLWQSGKSLRNPVDRSARAKVSQILIPAVVWSTWLIRNHVVFRGSIPYAENIWESVIRMVSDWGVFCVGATSVRLIDGVLDVRE